MNETAVEESPGILRPDFSYGTPVVESVLANPDFQKQYPASTEVERKYSIARALLADGRIPEAGFLLDGLVPTSQVLSKSSITDERKAEVVEKGTVLRESLLNFMVEKGIIEPPTWNMKRASQDAERYITNNERLKSLVGFFGPSSAVDILYRLHPQFKGIQPERVKGMIAEYLGDFLLQSGPLNLEAVSDKLPYLSEPNLREGLVEVWKRDVLKRLSDLRHSDFSGSERDAVESIFARYQEEAQSIQDAEFHSVFDQVKSYYLSLFDIEKPHHLVDSLNGGRPFPDLNQRINIREIEDKKRMLIADEMGLGKSASAILAKEKLGVKNALIIAPSNVISVWQNFLSDKIDPNGKQLGYFKEGSVPRVLTVQSPEELASINANDFDYILLSQERLNEEHVASLQNIDVGMLIVDEFHKLKNLRDGVRAGHLIDLAERMEGEDKYVALLSGTPIPNKVEDIAIALKLLYPDQFKNTESATLIRSIIQGDIVDIRSLLLPRMQAKELSESLKMPELDETTTSYNLQGLEKDIYEEILNDDEIPSASKLQTLRQFLLNPDIVDPTPGIFGSKIESFSQLLNHRLENGDKAVIFANDFTNGVIRGDNTILQKLNIPEGVKVEIIDGPISQEDRLRIQNELREHDGKMVVFVSGQTADVGVDFSAADSVDFYNEPWSKFNKRQQLARVYRPGVEHDIESSTSIGKGTIEEGINRYIIAKERAILKLLKGIPTTEIEKQLLEHDDAQLDEGLGVNPELAEYYFSSWDRMNKIFAFVKERGEKSFTDFLRNYAKSYAGAYSDLGTRSYQANASRISGTLIDKFVDENGQGTEEVKILDIASGPEMLSRHIPDTLSNNVVSLDINRQHFTKEGSSGVAGSFLALPFRDDSIDYANLSLAWHYTSFAPSKDDLERITVLAEANRVLKKGGRLILNNIYSLDLKNEELFEELIWSLGFKIIPEYSGKATDSGTYSSQIFTLEKVEYPGLSAQEIAQLIGKDHYDGLKFVRSNTKLKDTRKVLEQTILNDTVIPVNLNEKDRSILEFEKQTTSLGEDLKSQYGGIENIPTDEIISQGFVRILIGNKYVLFKKVPEAEGAVIIK